MKPEVSIIVPCYNEHKTITLLLDAIRQQSYPTERLEVVIADGMSTDGTRDVINTYIKEHIDLHVQVVDNTEQNIPSALNRAIERARGEWIIRLDAHAIPHPDYVARCLEVLAETDAANVGGVWEIRSAYDRWIPRAIAVAAAHTLGAGGARYRVSGPAGAVDTVPFGAFRRDWIQKVGLFDENLLTNEDYEYNVRLRKAGGVVWFDPRIRSTYFSRGGLQSLARQYFRYGYWKFRMLLQYPTTIQWRQILPPLFVLMLLVLSVLSPFYNLARSLLAIQLAVYLMTIIFAGAFEGLKRKDLGLLLGFPLALITMHFSWGGGFLWSFLRSMLGGFRVSR